MDYEMKNFHVTADKINIEILVSSLGGIFIIPSFFFVSQQHYLFDIYLPF